MLVDFLRSHESAKGNVIIYVSSSTGEHRLNSLIDLLQGTDCGNLLTTLFEFSTSFNTTMLAERRILIVTNEDMMWGLDNDHDLCQVFALGVTAVLDFDSPTNVMDYTCVHMEDRRGSGDNLR